MNENLITEVKDVDEQTQEMVNRPPVNPKGFDPGVEDYIKDVMKRVNQGEIDLMVPSTLINHEVYDQASEEIQGKADISAVNFCSKLREIRGLMQLSGGDQFYIEPTYQAELLVEDLFYRKNEFEQKYGNLFVI